MAKPIVKNIKSAASSDVQPASAQVVIEDAPDAELERTLEAVKTCYPKNPLRD